MLGPRLGFVHYHSSLRHISVFPFVPHPGNTLSLSFSLLLQFQQALERVRAGADVMPQGQLQKVVSAELGPDWRSKMASFEDEPLAAASIGQVGSCHNFMLFSSNVTVVIVDNSSSLEKLQPVPVLTLCFCQCSFWCC